MTSTLPTSIVIPGTFGETPDWLVPIVSQVQDFCHAWTRETGCKVLLAADTGSRARGLAGPASDFDVRLVYLPPREWYYSVDRRTLRDTITGKDFEALGITIPQGIDLVGYELTKFLGLVRGSNPTALEILGSSLVYYVTSMAYDLRALRDMPHKRQALVGHYASQAITQVSRDRLLAAPATVKGWLMFLVPALSALWAKYHGQPPPLSYYDLLDYMGPRAYNEARLLGHAKRTGQANKAVTAGDLPNLASWTKEFVEDHPRPTEGMMTQTSQDLIDAVASISREAARLS